MGTQSIRLLSLPGDPFSSETSHTRKISCQKRKRVGTQDESNRRATAISILSDDVLLEIFDFYRKNHHTYSQSPVWEWHILVHVCQRWRQLVFASPQRLKLQILCTRRTPVTNLGIWPALPITLLLRSNLHTLIDEVNLDVITTALEHPDRVCSVGFFVTGSQLGKIAIIMQEPLPVLTHLHIVSWDENVPVLPAKFLGGSAPRLQKITLSGLSFPALGTLLLSTSDLTILFLRRIPPTGYIPPETMVSCLSTLPRLETCLIDFQKATSRPDQIHPPPVTRTVLPALTSFIFQGAFEYLEDLVARIDSPRLTRTNIHYLNRLVDVSVAQLSSFIDRSVGPESRLTPSRHAYVSLHNDRVSFTLYRHANYSGGDGHPIETIITSEAFDLELSHMAQVLSRFSATLVTVVHLELKVYIGDESDLEGTEDVDWLHLFHQFPAVQTLHVSWELAELVAPAMEAFTEEMSVKVLPSLHLIFLEDQPTSSIQKFIAVRRLSGRPVTIINTEAEFERLVPRYEEEYDPYQLRTL